MDSAGRRRSWATWHTRRRAPGSSPCRADASRASSGAHESVKRRASVIVSAATVSALLACGGSPAAPGSALPLIEGSQLLTLTGFAASGDPALPPCTPVGLPRDGTSVNTVVVLALENGNWVARSSANLGTIELRLQPGSSSPLGYGVTGTITGTGTDVGLMGVTRDVRVTLSSTTGGAATFDGEVTSRSSRLVVGRVTGAVRFMDSQGASSTCQAIQWSMQPY